MYAGRISKEKGIENLFVAWNEAKLNKFELHLIGEGPQKEDLEKVTQVKKLSFLDKWTMIKLLNILAIKAVATNKMEGQPRLYEAHLLEQLFTLHLVE